MNVAALRALLAGRLATIPNLTVYSTAPAKPEVPCAIVQLVSVAPIELWTACDVRFSVQVLVQLADWESAQTALDKFISTGSASSVINALEAPSPGTDNVEVVMVDNYGHLPLGEVHYGSVTFTCAIPTP